MPTTLLRRITGVAILLALSVAPSRLLACVIGSGIPEKDLAQALDSNEEAFVVRLLSFQEAPPPPGEMYFLNQANYALVEVIKGRPDPSGTLSERNPYHPVAGQRPGPACGPWLLLPDRVGTTAIVFASRDSRVRPGYLWVDPFSRALDGSADSKATLDLIRKLQLEKEAEE